MIKINLLGKKKIKGPLGLDVEELLSKLGYSGRVEDLAEFKPQLVKVFVFGAFFYLSGIAPDYWLEENLKTTDVELATVTEQQDKLKRDLDSKKEIRAQMTKLVKDEGDTKRQLDIINSLSANRSQLYRAVERVGGLMPALAWIDNFEITDKDVKITGGAWDYTPINDFVKGLTETNFFQGVRLEGINSVDAPELIPDLPRDKQKVKNYTIQFGLGTGASSGG